MQNRKPLVFAGPNDSGKSQEHWVKQRRRCYRKMQSITDNSGAFVIVKKIIYISLTFQSRQIIIKSRI